MTLILIFNSGFPETDLHLSDSMVLSDAVLIEVNTAFLAGGARAVRCLQTIEAVAVVSPQRINARVSVVDSNPTVVSTEAS